MNNEKIIKEFELQYISYLETIEKKMNYEALMKLSSHWFDVHPQIFDLKKYLRLSLSRYKRILSLIMLHHAPGSTILDIGGFFGAFDVALQKIGYRVTLSEKYEYYDDGFEEVLYNIQSNSVSTISKDLVGEVYNEKKFDLVLCLAVLEHVPHSPKILLDNIVRSAREKGGVIVEVPNIAYFSKRRGFFLKGVSPLPHIKNILKSEPPYIGHHHEYTYDELEYIFKEFGICKIDEIHFNYSIEHWIEKLKNLPAFLFKKQSEVIAFYGTKN